MVIGNRKGVKYNIMSSDLFSRALENAESITAEELKFTLADQEKVQQHDLQLKDGPVVEADVSVGDKTVRIQDESIPEEDKEKVKGDEVDDNSSSEYDSSSSDSSEEESFSSSGEEEEGEEEDQEDVDEEDDDDEPNTNEPIRSKNEIIEEKIIALPDDYKIDVKTNISEIGIIKSVFESNVIVQGLMSGEKRVLKEGSIFCLDNREVVGTLAEVFGQLQHPFYRVGISPVNESKNDIIDKVKGMIGSKIYIVVPDAHWIDTFELKRIKGTDASNGYDEELPEDEQEFSDDEKEAQYKRMKKNQKKKKNNDKSNETKKNNINNNKVNKKRQPYHQHNTNPSYAKMKLPIGMTKQNIYKSRSNRHTDDHTGENMMAAPGSDYHNRPSYTMQVPAGYPNQYPQSGTTYLPNYNNFAAVPQQSYPQSGTMYPPPQYQNTFMPQQQHLYPTPGQTPFGNNGQFSGYRPGYNQQQFNYSGQNFQQYTPPQTAFQQYPVHNQNQSPGYQQNPTHLPFQQQPPPPSSSSTLPPQTLDQVQQLHHILLQQQDDGNNQELTSQNNGNHGEPRNDIPY